MLNEADLNLTDPQSDDFIDILLIKACHMSFKFIVITSAPLKIIISLNSQVENIRAAAFSARLESARGEIKGFKSLEFPGTLSNNEHWEAACHWLHVITEKKKVIMPICLETGQFYICYAQTAWDYIFWVCHLGQAVRWTDRRVDFDCSAERSLLSTICHNRLEVITQNIWKITKVIVYCRVQRCI